MGVIFNRVLIRRSYSYDKPGETWGSLWEMDLCDVLAGSLADELELRRIVYALEHRSRKQKVDADVTDLEVKFCLVTGLGAQCGQLQSLKDIAKQIAGITQSKYQSSNDVSGLLVRPQKITSVEEACRFIATQKGFIVKLADILQNHCRSVPLQTLSDKPQKGIQ